MGRAGRAGEGGGRWAGPAKKGQEGGEKAGGLGWDMAPGLRPQGREDTQQLGPPHVQQVPFQALPALPATFHPA